jgi:hypothetical protein
MTSINKILLINDVRGSHENLYTAFKKLGIDCDIALFGSSLSNKAIDYKDFDQFRKYKSFGKIPRVILNYFMVKNLEDYDVSSYVHRITFLDRPEFLRLADVPYLRNKSKIMSYTGLGCDEISFIYGSEALPYKPCESCQKYDEAGKRCEEVIRGRNELSINNLNRYFDTFVSTAIEYDHIQKKIDKKIHRIPLPVNIQDIPWVPAKAKGNNTVKIVHTPSRKGFKGTDIVCQAIEVLRTIRSDFEFKIISGLSFHEYTNQIQEADIVIDQVWSQSPGMNALWLLAMGKIVFSGNTEIARSYFKFSKSSPIINAEPNAESLARELSNAISNRGSFTSISEYGREYIKSNHDSDKIAMLYLEMWKNAL